MYTDYDTTAAGTSQQAQHTPWKCAQQGRCLLLNVLLYQAGTGCWLRATCPIANMRQWLKHMALPLPHHRPLQLQVLLLSDYGLSAPTPRARPLQPLHLPDPDPLLTHLAAEAAAYWGGLQALTGAPLLAAQQSLDVVLDPERDHAGAVGFSKLQV